MDRGNIQSPVFAEEGNPLHLDEMSAYCIYSHGIGSHDQPLIGPHISFIEKISSPSIELGREGTEDIQTGLSLSDAYENQFGRK